MRRILPNEKRFECPGKKALARLKDLLLEHFPDLVRAVSYQVFRETNIDISLLILEERKFKYLVKFQAPFIENVEREGIPVL